MQLIYYYSNTCHSCHTFKENIEQIKKDYPLIDIQEINVTLAKKNVTSVPQLYGITNNGTEYRIECFRNYDMLEKELLIFFKKNNENN